MRDDLERVLITKEQIRERVAELGKEISRDYAGKDLVLVGILRGAAVFMADLAREITIPVVFDFISCSSYGASTKSSGVVRFLKDLDQPIEGKHVLIIEDIVDTGLTLSYLLENLESRDPASLAVCTLCSKPARRKTDVQVAYNGFTIPDEFVVGYGLDFAERYRNLPCVMVLKPEIYQ